MTLIDIAWESLNDKKLKYNTYLEYSGRFSDYNGSIILKGNDLTVKLSKKWKDVSTDIQIGIIQHLICRLFKKKKKTVNIDLYNSFIKNIHKSIIKKKCDVFLEESFSRINDRFFGNAMEKPNLKWCTGSKRLGWYHYGSDTVAISKELKSDLDLLDYVMYHEILHKYHKFKTVNGRSTYHSREFKLDEAKYPNAKLLEKRLLRLNWLGRIM